MAKNRVVAIVVVLVVLTFFSQPLLAQRIAVQANPERVCPPPPDASGSSPWVSSFVPLQASERLIYALAELSAGSLEVRYRVNGTLHLTEVIDLTKMRFPERTAESPDAIPGTGGFLQLQKRADGAALPPRREAVEARPVIELLALHPDSTRQLHRLAREGGAIEMDILHDGRLRESISFVELVSRGAELRQGSLLPVFAPPQVSGPGKVGGARRQRVATNEYLENCWECTTSHPCDTECGYDPGKGGPTTCGEYGAPCEPWCAPSYTSGEWWTSWTLYSTGYGFGECLHTWFGYRWHNERIATYRRERIRRTTTCPNSPSCNGCYDTEAVIDVQYSYISCYEETGAGCFNGSMPCCSTCSVYGWSTCTSGSNCF